jgi:hypothetical protein
MAPPVDPSPAGGLPWADLYPTTAGAGIRRPTYRPPYSVPASLTSTILAAANPARSGVQITNDSTASLFIGLGPVVSSVSYTAKVGPGGLYVIGKPGPYLGDLSGVWSAINGSARITETAE